VSCGKKFNVQSHIDTGLHKENVKYLNALHDPDTENPTGSFTATKQPTLNLFSNDKLYREDMCKAFLAANIPFHKLENKIFSDFLHKYTSKNTPSESSIRKDYLPKEYIKVP
jgi:hypothetical protein